MNRRYSWLIGLLLMLAGLSLAAPAQAKEKIPEIDLGGLTVLMGGAPAPAAIPAPSPTPITIGAAAATTTATDGLTLDRFALGFALIVVGTLGAAAIMLTMRRLRRSVNTIMAQPGDAGEKKNT